MNEEIYGNHPSRGFRIAIIQKVDGTSSEASALAARRVGASRSCPKRARQQDILLFLRDEREERQMAISSDVYPSSSDKNASSSLPWRKMRMHSHTMLHSTLTFLASNATTDECTIWPSFSGA